MPLFMDRHDLPGVTAEQVAQAHLLDLEASQRHQVQFLTYWYDADAGAAFCLARAPQASNLRDVHRESHGLVPNEIIQVGEGNVLKFLGRIEEPVAPTDITSPFRAVMFTDLEGSTALLSELGEAPYLVVLTEHDLIIRRALVANRGREVKHTGDGIMASFDDAGRALSCASAIQHALSERDASGQQPPLSVRIGLAAGEPVDRDDDLFGSTVNLASRLCSAAAGGQTMVSELVKDIGVQAGYEFGNEGTRILKGFPGPTPVFMLQREPARG